MSFRAQREISIEPAPTPAGENVVRLWRQESKELGPFLTLTNGRQNEETGHRNARRFEHKGV